MTDDLLIFGEPLDADEMDGNTKITEQDIQEAIIWWDEIASDLFIGVLDEG